MSIVLKVLRLFSACFLTAAFIFMFMSMKNHLFVDAFLKGYSECLMEIPGGQPEATVAKSQNPGN